jgi:hypothetical protein
MGQFFDHMGFDVLDKWYILSEFIGSEEMSTQGRMGGVSAPVQAFNVTIPLAVDGITLTRIISQIQWSQNAVTVRNLGTV